MHACKHRTQAEEKLAGGVTKVSKAAKQGGQRTGVEQQQYTRCSQPRTKLLACIPREGGRRVRTGSSASLGGHSLMPVWTWQSPG